MIASPDAVSTLRTLGFPLSPEGDSPQPEVLMGDLLVFNRRRLRRNHMIKGAEILVGGTGFKVAVLDAATASR